MATDGLNGRGNPADRALAAALSDSALPGEADHIDPAAAGRIVAFVEGAAAVRAPNTPVVALEATAAERGHPGRRRLALAIVNDNMPFLVDSASLAITAAGLGIDRLLHPIVDVRRDADGRLVKLLGIGAGPVPDGATRESIIYVELERAGARSRAELLDALDRVLADVRAAVDDWPAMLTLLQETTRALGDNPPPVAPHAAAEAMAFLEWLAADRFTLLGTRRYALDAAGNELPDAAGLGLLRDPAFKVWDDDGAATSASLHKFLTSPEPLLITKAGAVSTVHRRVNADLIAVKTFDREGRAIAEMTQAGRIEFASRGGRLNTDFIDNSAGVDCSDNEVNIKIALTAEVAAGRLTEDARNTLLASMTIDDRRERARLVDEIDDLPRQHHLVRPVVLARCCGYAAFLWGA